MGKKILYYYWGEICKDDCIAWLRQLGHEVTVLEHTIESYDMDEKFMQVLRKQLREGYDAVFSFNYYPDIARVVDEGSVLYISWVYDSPHLTLDSVTLGNPNNRVFLFDRSLCVRHMRRGIKTVFYMPLAMNPERLDRQAKALSNASTRYQMDVSFLGSLYTDQKNYLDQITHMPPELRGYIDAIVVAQKLIYGMDLAGELMTRERCNALARCANVDMGKLYRDNRDDVFRDFVRRKITAVERTELLARVGERYNLTLFSESRVPDSIKAQFGGYVDYLVKMPEVFYTSKINLNITLRSILSGIPLRVIDILGAHGFALTNYQEELPEYFTYGQDIVWFESPDDLMDKIDYYLKHDDEREQIAENGNARARQIFTYEQLLPQIFEMAFR